MNEEIISKQETVKKQLQDHLKSVFNLIDTLSPSGREDCAWEDSLWELKKIEESLDSAKLSCKDIIYELGLVEKGIDTIREIVRNKIHNPYQFSEQVERHLQ